MIQFAKITSAAVAALFAIGSAAQAANVTVITDPLVEDTFTSFGNGGAGVQGVELRGGNGQLNGTWEAGLGQQTSQTGTFVQAQYQFVENASGQDFVYAISSAGVGTFKIIEDGVTLVDLTWDDTPLQLGKAIEFFAKRQAELTITEINGMAFNFNVGTFGTDSQEKLIIYSEDFLNGFEIKGTFGVLNGKNSTHGIVMKAGNIELAAVPVPAAGLLFAGAAGLGAVRRLRRR